MQGQLSGRPTGVLSKNTTRTVGKDALAMNSAAGQAVGMVVRTTLGPQGMDKLLVDSSGNVLVTNDGVTMLQEMDIEHPAADLVVDVARTQEAEVGDGTTSAVVITGSLLEAAESLLDDDIHPTAVVGGYRRARQLAAGAIDELAESVDPTDRNILEAVAATSLTGKSAEQQRDLLARIVVDAVTDATDAYGNVDRDLIRLRTFYGQSMAESEYREGVTLGKRPPHPMMPEDVPDATVLVFEGAIELSELELDVEARVSDADTAGAFAEHDREELASLVDPIIEMGVDVVVAGEGIDDWAQGRFADAGVLAFRRVDEADRKRIARATDATRIADLDILEAKHLGFADRVARERIRPTRYAGAARPERVFSFDGGAGGGVGTIWLRGGTDQVVDEVERGIEDAIDVVSRTLSDGAILPGGGAIEMELAQRIRSAAAGVDGREQLAVEAFADALEVIPRTLAQTAGHNQIDALVELAARHDEGQRSAGLDADSGHAVDVIEAGVIEPKSVKATALTAAVDAATTILRIDDVVAAGDLAVGDESADETDEF